MNHSQQATIWTAARDGDVERIRELVADGANLDATDRITGTTPLTIAASRGHVDAIKRLFAEGAGVNVRNKDGSIPLHSAVLFRRPETVRVLLEHGADLGARSRLGESPADMIDVGGLRLIVVSSFGGVEVDTANTEEVVRILTEAGQSSPSSAKSVDPDEGPRTAGSGADMALGMVMLMLTLFPLFHHLWFLWFLCWLVAGFAIYALLITAIKWKPPRWLVLSPLRYAWLIPLTVVPQSMMGLLYPNFGPDTSTGILPMPEILLYYAIFFLFGAMYFDCDDHESRLGRWWYVTLPAALLIVFPVGYELSTGMFGFTSAAWLDAGWVRPASVVLQVVYVWLMTFGLMGMFRSLLARESKVMRYISDSSYWLYVAHLPLIIVAQSMVQTWQIPAIAKLTIVCVGSSLLLLASYQLFVRYTPIGTLLNGPRKRPGKAAA